MPTEPALDDDTAALIAAALDPVPMPPAAAARVKRRLLQRVAADSTPRHHTVPAGEAGWQPFGEGLSIKVLHEAGGVMSYLVRLAPGAALAPHRHPLDEECVVLEGEVQIGALRVGPGGYHRGLKDVLHDHVASEGGALIFLRGAAPDLTQLL
ncbi:MAG: cupin domain-containing protein [Rubrivivax sp.]